MYISLAYRPLTAWLLAFFMSTNSPALLAATNSTDASSACSKVSQNFTQEDEAETEGRLAIILRNLDRCNELIKRRSKMPDIASISRQSSVADPHYSSEDPSSPVGSPQAKDFPIMQGEGRRREANEPRNGGMNRLINE